MLLHNSKVTQSHFNWITLWDNHSVTQSCCYTISLLHNPTVTQSDCYTLLNNQTVTHCYILPLLCTRNLTDTTVRWSETTSTECLSIDDLSGGGFEATSCNGKTLAALCWYVPVSWRPLLVGDKRLQLRPVFLTPFWRLKGLHPPLYDILRRLIDSLLPSAYRTIVLLGSRAVLIPETYLTL